MAKRIVNNYKYELDSDHQDRVTEAYEDACSRVADNAVRTQNLTTGLGLVAIGGGLAYIFRDKIKDAFHHGTDKVRVAFGKNPKYTNNEVVIDTDEFTE